MIADDGASLSRELCRLVTAKAVSAQDLRLASLFVLDTIACALGGRGSEPARMLLAVVSADSADPARRAFLFGGLCHILELDDLHRASVTHPGSVVIPAAWAVADAANLGGRAFLTAVLRGYETCARVGRAVGPGHYRVWHNTSTCGPFGAAMAASGLLDLNEDQSVWALGNAGTQSSGLWEFLSSGGLSKHLHTARAAESGVLAALLARQGFSGPERILEGERGFFRALCPDPAPAAVTAKAELPWELTQTSMKPWPCCRHMHPAIDATLDIHQQLRGEEVVEVKVATYRAALDVCDRPKPQDNYAAKFSLQHGVAAALLDGGVAEASFALPARVRLASFAARVSLAVSPEIDRAYPLSWGAEVQLRTAGGRLLHCLRPGCKGDPESPMSETEITHKAETLLAQAGLGGRAAEELITSIRRLEDDLPVRALGLAELLAGRPS